MELEDGVPVAKEQETDEDCNACTVLVVPSVPVGWMEYMSLYICVHVA